MAQITHGTRAILSFPSIYSFFQLLMGAHQFRQNIVTCSIKPFPGMKVLDIGCGPADILDYLPDVDYWGFDINEEYIHEAQEKFGNRGNFQCKQIQLADLTDLPSFDVVLAIGLLHHLDDTMAKAFFQLALKALRKEGRLLTVDPCLDPSQNPIARFLVCHDRGQNVRNKDGYQTLVQSVFPVIHVEIHRQVWIPYTRCIMECQK